MFADRRVRWTRRAFLASLGTGLALSLGCTQDGHIALLGYSSQPNYDTSIRTVYVPIFQNRVFQTGPYRGIEFDLTRAVIEEIERTTPYKVVSDPDRADTELLGSVVTLTKSVLNVNLENEVRNLEYFMSAEVVWRDLRTGRILSNPRPSAAEPGFIEPFDPSVPLPVIPIEQPIPAQIYARGRVLPELGESSTTGLKMAIDRIAVQVVQLMEKPY